MTLNYHFSNNHDDDRDYDIVDNKVEKEAQEIQSIIKEVREDTCFLLLTVLQSMINEQVTAGQLKKDVGRYLYDAVKDQCMRKGWIN